MRYVSTRGAAPPKRFSDILLEGLAPDGGLYVPETFPQADLGRLRRLSYPELAQAVLAPYMDDVDGLPALLKKVYSPEVFGSADVTPLKTLEPGLHLLGLSNGPTLAFKDIALQLLGELFEKVLGEKNRKLNILGATSGDTGPAAEYAMRGRRGIQVFMLSPHQRMTEFQAAQMYSLQDRNIHNFAVRGVFDDCQDVVKAVNADAGFKARYSIGAVNSINWARVAAQVVYYFKGYFAATRLDSEPVSFAVPTGNFGNILAGYVARRMGLPVRRLILATNENDVLDQYFRTGVYRARREVASTSSPSMDISKASNFERYAFELTGRDGARTQQFFSGSEFRLAPGAEFVSGRSSHAERLATIRKVFEQHGAVIDPHTADGVKVGLEHREPGVPLVCLETALPAKFSATIVEALGRGPERPAALADLERRPQRVLVIDPDATAVKGFIAERA